jgi:DNA mismatch repair protein MutL
MVEMDPQMVDVNVHPGKLQVKFADSKLVYQLVYNTISETLGGNKIATATQHTASFSFSSSSKSQGSAYSPSPNLPSVEQLFEQSDVSSEKVSQIFGLDSLVESPLPPFTKGGYHTEIGEYQVIGQLRNSYIVLQSADALYYIDQHALAERIAYETMKKEQKLTAEILLQPLKFEITHIPNLPDKIAELNQL